MKCDKCGNEIPSQSKFCLTCGASVSHERAEFATPAPMRKGKLGLLAGATAVCVVAIVVAVMALQGRGSRVTDVAPVRNPQQPPVFNAPTTPSPPQPGVLQSDVEKPPIKLDKPEKPKPPPEVVAYLEHLKKVEQTRLALQQREIAALGPKMAEMIRGMYGSIMEAEEPKAGGQMTKELSGLSREWQQLSAYFLSVQPPEPCRALGGKYYDALRDVIATMGKLQDMIVKLDLNVMQMRGQSTHIDEKLVEADRELGDVCKRFGIEKTFSIRPDSGMPGIFGP